MIRDSGKVKYQNCPIYNRSSSAAYSHDKCRCEVCKQAASLRDCASRGSASYKKHFKFRQIKWKYGITEDQYGAILMKQNGGCAICKQQGVRLEVDHCHGSGKVRGLLCGRCNKGIGLFSDSVENILSAAKYLGDQ